MELTFESQFIRFLEHDLLVSHAAIVLALKHHEGYYDLLPIVLWQYGLTNLDEMDCMFDWLENQQFTLGNISK